MPQNITDADTFTATVQTPASGEPRTANSVKTPVQGLADRTRWLYNRALDRIGVASSAALKALAAPADGAFRIVTSAGALGLFRFRAGSPLGADYAPFVYDANDGSGYWEHMMARLMVLGGYGGNQPRLDTGTIRVPNSIINIYEQVETSPTYRQVFPPTGNPAWDDTGFEMTLPLTIGDKALVRAGFGLASATEAGAVARLAVTSGGTTGIDGSQRSAGAPSAGFTAPTELSGLYIVPATANYTFKVQVQGAPTNDIRIYLHRRMEVLVIRP